MLSEYLLDNLKGVGPKQQEKLQKLGLFTVQDLLFHLPLRYQDKTNISPLSSILNAQEVQVEGEIISQKMTQSHKPSLLITIMDKNNETLTCRFFHIHPRQAQQFKNKKMLRAYGEVRYGPTGLEMVHPSYQIFNKNNSPKLDDTLHPIYPTTEGLGQKNLLNLIIQALDLLKQLPLEEALPKNISTKHHLPNINHSLLTLHQPQPEDNLALIQQFKHPAQQRLIFEELLTHQIGLQTLRQVEQQRLAPAFPASQNCNALLTSLPFTLTKAQQLVWSEIQDDLKQPYPMQRMVQGDVGSGKTVVAALAAIQVADVNYQVAIMAPTEILAEQHKEAFLQWLEPLDIPVAWLNGRMKAAEKRFMLAQIASGKAKVIVGTHALFQDSVIFNQLGLVVIDEQHRFGVHQRLSLQTKGIDNQQHPHQLIMTATPIPRTLAMTAYGDLDLSVIDELPPGRKPIETAVLKNTKRLEVMEHLYKKCQEGVQAYWVCPLIEESELLHAQAAEVTAQQFRELWPNLRIGLIHGRLKGAEKSKIMTDFKNHKLDLLVATTVIEVGVDVPNASLMIIENAERLGLAQLHQLRGRVGRGDKQSHCVLLYLAPLSAIGKARLSIMRTTTDGFKIAEEDLRLRGAGEILGTRQTGGLQFKISDLIRDEKWIPIVKTLAQHIVVHSPLIAKPLKQRWVGNKDNYKHT